MTIKTFRNVYINLSGEEWDTPFVAMLLLVELILGTLIILKVPYTEIDWIAYMQEVDFWWIDGEYDYMNIYGNTGPLVYPAGFLYLFRGLQVITNREIPQAQLIFLGFYIATQAVILKLYMIILQEIRQRRQQQQKTEENQSSSLALRHTIWSFRIAMGCLCLSKRFHSIFLLRLFNDAPTMLVAYLSFYCFMTHRWNIGCFIFSLAVSLKMNILLFAPGLLYLLIEASPKWTIPRLAICGFTQLAIGAPFLLRYPISYLRKAFELDRQFFYKWTVNWKFLPEETFLSKPLAIALLVLHLGLLGVYFWRQYNKKKGTVLSGEHILSTLFISNFVGICCARTLHYQFYCWYFSALPYLLWRQTKYPIVICLALLLGIEYAFLTFPATPTSSAVLQIAQWCILVPCVLGGGGGSQDEDQVESETEASKKTR